MINILKARAMCSGVRHACWFFPLIRVKMLNKEKNMLKKYTWLYILFLTLIYILVTFFVELRDSIHSIQGLDKVGHFLLLGILTYLVNRSLIRGTWRFGSWNIPRGSVLIALVFTLEEFSQAFIHTRSFSLLDLAANYLGVAVFTWVSIRSSLPKPRSKFEHYLVQRYRDAA